MINEDFIWISSINKIESYRKEKQEIIDDLEMCISYTPNKENDLLCLMEQYIKGDLNDRLRLLEQIKLCIDEEEYENPFLTYNCYTELDIKKLESILDNFIDKLKDSHGETKEIERNIKNTILKINDLHDKCSGQLIDAWRNERLVKYLITATEYAGYSGTKGIIKANKLW